MTKEDIIDIANDIAFMACIWIDDEGNEINDLVKFAQLIEAKEREACAVIAEEWFCGCGHGNCPEGDSRAQDIANSIRARGEA